jgi:hypothetical protein
MYLQKEETMKRVICIGAGLMLFAMSAAAQAPKAGEKTGLAAGLQRSYAAIKGNLTKAAERMPESDYGFKVANTPDMRTYGQWIGHQADNQFINCAVLKGASNPSQGNEKKATKAELIKALNDAFAFCDGAISSLTDQNAVQLIKQGEGETARGAIVSALLAHALESNGIVTVYLRAKGLVPPNPPGGRGRGGAQ